MGRQVRRRDCALFVIATEGEKTEKQYFEGMFRSSRLQIHVLETDDGRSAPLHVRNRLDLFRDDYQLQATDELWLVIDTDRWAPAHLSELAQESQTGRYGLAVSNPCFETWLLLHFTADPGNPVRCEQVVTALRDKLGRYSKSDLEISMFKDKVPAAIENARTLSPRTSEARWPQNPGSHVYLLAESLSIHLA